MRHLVVWLVALVVPLQGLAVCLLQVRGPEHTHVRAQGDALLAADFRRDLGVNVDPARHFLVEVVHGHAHRDAHFHYHSVDNASVRLVDGDGFGGAPGDEGMAASDGASGTFLPMPVFVVDWSDPGISATPVPDPLWTPTAAFHLRLDRPPNRPTL